MVPPRALALGVKDLLPQQSVPSAGQVEDTSKYILSAISVGKRYLVTAGTRLLKIWSGKTFAPLYTVVAHRGAVTAMEIMLEDVDDGRSPQKRLLTAGMDHLLKVWDIGKHSGVCLRVLLVKFGYVTAVVSHKSQIVCGTSYGKLEVFDSTSYQHVHCVTADTAHVTALCVLQPYVISAGYDNAIKIWETKEFTCIHRVSVDVRPLALCIRRQAVVSSELGTAANVALIVGDAGGAVTTWQWLSPLHDYLVEQE
eukprot:TRINITY_DN3385_c0_g1_i1.p2 TRINITY_DN3385_c0_g1~~TRINITY_DN3385_c0_g1_i1.p2  ORF type:complete len:254 (+),score=53.99 TRINITY_DN3385_c0_g1_i1:1001-1762(+)